MRPRLTLLGPERTEVVIQDALRTLEQVGVFVEDDEGAALLKDAGMPVLAGGRIGIREEAVRQALATAPAGVLLAGRSGEPVLHLGGDEVHFDPGSAALHLLDARTERRRPPDCKDCARFAWLTEACQHIAAQATALVPADVPQALADRVRLYLALAGSQKPVVTGTFRADGFAVMHEMLVAVRGSREALRAKPLAVFDCCPTPPLKWSELTCRALIDCARAGVPAELVSMPMAGATAPVTLRDAVVQHAAESLSGVVIHQLAAPGAPVVFGGSPSALDMRFGTTPMGAMETMMIEVACAEVGKRFGLPTHAYLALSDAKRVDWQAGFETGMGALLAALAGINLVSGPGMLDYESCQSFEKLLLDNEACGAALRLARGMSDGAAGAAPELLGAVVEAGHFLAHPHTRRHFRREIAMPGRLIERGAYTAWEQRGGPDAFAAARTEVERVIARGNPAPLAPELERELRALMRAEARRLGVTVPEAVG